MDAAKAAARTVVERQPPTVRMGVVAFGTSGLVTQQPTADRASVLAAIDRLQPGRRHGAGQRAADVAERDHREDGAGRRAGHGRTGVEPQGPDLGYHGSAAVVLFSDGENTAEPDPVDVADLASSAGVRVYPVGIGSPRGTVIEVDGFQLATALDEPTLRTIAERTDGRYVAAADTAALAGVADAIDLEWKVETEHIEVTGLLAAVAGLLRARRRRALAALVRAGCLWASPGPSRSWRCSPCPCSPARTSWQLRRRRRQAVRYSSVALIRAAAPRRAAWKRHVPVALLLAALAALGLAAARPRLSVDVPVSESAMILALDVSGSMCATDVEPNRLTAAQAAVRDFVQAQDGDTRIGLVAVRRLRPGRGGADDGPRRRCCQAIDTLTTGRGTTIGAAILKSVDAIAEINPDVAPADPGRRPRRAPRRRGPPGSYAPEIVVLLTDGANTRGVEPVDAAQIAAQRGVRVYPIGFGTREPDVDGVHGGPARRAGIRGPRGGIAGGGAVGRPELPRRGRGHAAAGGRRHRRRVLRRGRRGPAAARAGGPARARCRPSTATSRSACGWPASRRCCCSGACGRRRAGRRSRPERGDGVVVTRSI